MSLLADLRLLSVRPSDHPGRDWLTVQVGRTTIEILEPENDQCHCGIFARFISGPPEPYVQIIRLGLHTLAMRAREMKGEKVAE